MCVLLTGLEWLEHTIIAVAPQCNGSLGRSLIFLNNNKVKENISLNPLDWMSWFLQQYAVLLWYFLCISPEMLMESNFYFSPAIPCRRRSLGRRCWISAGRLWRMGVELSDWHRGCTGLPSPAPPCRRPHRSLQPPWHRRSKVGPVPCWPPGGDSGG